MAPYPIKRLMLSLIFGFAVSLLTLDRLAKKGSAATIDSSTTISYGIGIIIFILIVDFIYFQFKFKSKYKDLVGLVGEQKAKEALEEIDGSKIKLDYLVPTFIILLVPFFGPTYYLIKSKNFNDHKRKFVRVVSIAMIVVWIFVVLGVVMAFANSAAKKNKVTSLDNRYEVVASNF